MKGLMMKTMKGKRILSVAAAFVALAAAAEVKPLEGPWLGKGETLVCFGDSITAAKNGYMSLLTEALAEKDVKVVNAGRSGDKTPMALTRLADVVAQKPDAVMLFFGANDSVIGRGRWRDEPTVDPVTFRDNLIWIVHALRQRAGVRKFSIVVPTGLCEGSGLEEFGTVYEAYRLAAREAADRTDAVLVPLDAAFVRASRTATPDAQGLSLTRDGVHYSAAGNELAAETMLKAWNMR